MPETTYNTDEAATAFEVRIQDDPMSAWQDVAAGAGGKYRYIISNNDQFSDKKIVLCRLYRSPDSGNTTPPFPKDEVW